MSTEARKQMARGKFDNLNALANEQGVIAALAVDMRGALKQSISQTRGSEISDAELSEFKAIVTEVLTPYASAILLDPEYSLTAISRRAPNAGVMLAYEKSGYDTAIKGRLPDLLPDWSVRRLGEAGAQGIKILLYYDPDDAARVNSIKQAYVERIGAECQANGLPFFLEPISYDDNVGDVQSLAFARLKPDKVARSIEEFSKPRYGVDILKVEVPVNLRYVEGSVSNPDGQVAYSRKEARQHFRRAAAASRLPLIYLSAGVSNEAFRELLGIAAEAGVSFSGVLCGRATWQGGVKAYGEGGAEALRRWLAEEGVQNIAQINRLLARTAKPWWAIYGGKDNIELI